MKKELMVLSLVGLLGCVEAKNDIHRTDQNIEYVKPMGCETVKDIRLELGHVSSRHYQVLCSDKDGNLTLYHRYERTAAWEKITVN